MTWSKTHTHWYENISKFWCKSPHTVGYEKLGRCCLFILAMVISVKHWLKKQTFCTTGYQDRHIRFCQEPFCHWNTTKKFILCGRKVAPKWEKFRPILKQRLRDFHQQGRLNKLGRSRRFMRCRTFMNTERSEEYSSHVYDIKNFRYDFVFFRWGKDELDKSV